MHVRRRRASFGDAEDSPGGDYVTDAEIAVRVRAVADSYVAALRTEGAADADVARATETGDVVAQYVEALVEGDTSNETIRIAASEAEIMLHDEAHDLGIDLTSVMSNYGPDVSTSALD